MNTAEENGRSESARGSEERCRACGGAVARAFEAEIMGDLQVTYTRCADCGSLMLLNPYWLDRAYSRVLMPDPDFGALRRSLFISRFVRRLRGTGILPRHYQSLDYGSGFGMLVRLQRDRGVEAWGYDRYAKPKFAEQYCSNKLPESKFDLVTCIEVIEHTVDPRDVLSSFRSMVKDNGLVLLSTELLDGQPDLEKWSYLAPEHGQHITLFSKAGLLKAVEAAGFDWVGTFRLHGIPLLHVLVPKTRGGMMLRLLLLTLRQWIGEAIYSNDFTV
jgi:hypothetical protein